MHDAQAVIPGWRTINQTLLDLARRQGTLDREVGPWLVLAQREGVHRALGYGSFEEYVMRRVGYDPRTTREKVRVARALETLPNLAGLLQTGARSWSTVRELVRVATPETEAAWIATTETLTVRQVEPVVSNRKLGDLPTDTKDPLFQSRRPSMFQHARRELYGRATGWAAHGCAGSPRDPWRSGTADSGSNSAPSRRALRPSARTRTCGSRSR